MTLWNPMKSKDNIFAFSRLHMRYCIKSATNVIKSENTEGWNVKLTFLPRSPRQQKHTHAVGIWAALFGTSSILTLSINSLPSHLVPEQLEECHQSRENIPNHPRLSDDFRTSTKNGILTNKLSLMRYFAVSNVAALITFECHHCSCEMSLSSGKVVCWSFWNVWCEKMLPAKKKKKNLNKSSMSRRLGCWTLKQCWHRKSPN